MAESRACNKKGMLRYRSLTGEKASTSGANQTLGAIRGARSNRGSDAEAPFVADRTTRASVAIVPRRAGNGAGAVGGTRAAVRAFACSSAPIGASTLVGAARVVTSGGKRNIRPSIASPGRIGATGEGGSRDASCSQSEQAPQHLAAAAAGCHRADE